MGNRRLDVGVDSVIEVYAGPGGVLWEILMGEEIHVGGARDTDALARQAGITSSSKVLDVVQRPRRSGAAPGANARLHRSRPGCHSRMYDEAVRRTKEAGLDGKATYVLGNALDIPHRAASFDVVWGQDAWCYVTDKERLVCECARVVRPGEPWRSPTGSKPAP